MSYNNKGTLSVLTAFLIFSACTEITQPSSTGNSQEITASKTETVSSLSDTLENAADLSASLENLKDLKPEKDEITGASSQEISQLSNARVLSNWVFGPYLFKYLNSNSNNKISLDYTTRSGGPAYAHVWGYKNGSWQALGWAYRSSTPGRFQGTFELPSGYLGMVIGFFSSKESQVDANVSINSSVNSINSDIKNKFQIAVSRTNGLLGNATSEIVKADTVNAFKQSFSNGLVTLRDGDSNAYAMYGKIFEKWRDDQNTAKYGLPISDIKPGLTLNGQSSTYQLFDKDAVPSLHSWSKGVFHMNDGIRKAWQSRAGELGHPTNDETAGSQSFENGRVTWSTSENKANVFIGKSEIENSCFNYPVGDEPGTYIGYNNASPFQASDIYYRGIHYGWHLGEDLNGNSGKDPEKDKKGGDRDFDDPVFSIGYGQVTSVQRLGGSWGNLVFIKHHLNGKPYTSMYAHLNQILVSKDDFVYPKQKIGTIGNANGYYLAHLHLEIRNNHGITAGAAYTKPNQISGGTNGVGPNGQINAMKLIRDNYCN